MKLIYSPVQYRTLKSIFILVFTSYIKNGKRLWISLMYDIQPQVYGLIKFNLTRIFISVKWKSTTVWEKVRLMEIKFFTVMHFSSSWRRNMHHRKKFYFHATNFFSNCCTFSFHLNENSRQIEFYKWIYLWIDIIH